MGNNTGNITGAISGFMKGQQLAESRKMRQELHTQKLAAGEQQATSIDQTIQTQALKIDALQKRLVQDDARNAVVGLSTGSVATFNSYLKDPIMRSLFNDYTNVEEINGKLIGTKVLPEGTTQKSEVPQRLLQDWALQSGAQTILNERNKSSLEANQLKMEKDALATGNMQTIIDTYFKLNPKAYSTQSAGGEKRRDALKQATIAFFRGKPNATKEEAQQFFRTYTQKITQGVGSVREEKDVNQVITQGTKQPTVTTPQQQVSQEQKTMAAMKNTNKGQYDRIQKDLTSMKDKSNLSTNIRKVLDGSAKEVDTDVIASIVDTANTWTGTETKQTLTNEYFKTASGMLIADYILSRSGTAASDTERDFLTGLMKSGKIADEVYVRNSLEAFAKSLESQNRTTGEKIKKWAPDSVKQYSKIQQTASAADFD